jgi:hypothetical protein
MRELEEEIEERSLTFSNLAQDINKLKANLTSYEEVIDTKTR